MCDLWVPVCVCIGHACLYVERQPFLTKHNFLEAAKVESHFCTGCRQGQLGIATCDMLFLLPFFLWCCQAGTRKHLWKSLVTSFFIGVRNLAMTRYSPLADPLRAALLVSLATSVYFKRNTTNVLDVSSFEFLQNDKHCSLFKCVAYWCYCNWRIACNISLLFQLSWALYCTMSITSHFTGLNL